MYHAIVDSDLHKLYPGVEFGQSVSIGSGVTIGEGTRISHGVRIYPGTSISSQVSILENTVIGRPTVLPRSSSLVKRELGEDVPATIIEAGTVIGASVVLYRGVHLGRNNIICDLTSIREHCRLGDDVLLGRGVMVQVNTQIGARTKIMDTCQLPGDMIIEEDVFLSTHVCGASENTLGREANQTKWSGPYLCQGAYVGANATLLPGVRINENAVVAAGALVTKDVQAGTLVMGVPARFIRNVSDRIK